MSVPIVSGLSKSYRTHPPALYVPEARATMVPVAAPTPRSPRSVGPARMAPLLAPVYLSGPTVFLKRPHGRCRWEGHDAHHHRSRDPHGGATTPGDLGNCLAARGATLPRSWSGQPGSGSAAMLPL